MAWLKVAVLADGRQVTSDHEDWRHECEARDVLAEPTKEQRRARIAAVEKRRGLAEADRLQATAQRLFAMRQHRAHAHVDGRSTGSVAAVDAGAVHA